MSASKCRSKVPGHHVKESARQSCPGCSESAKSLLSLSATMRPTLVSPADHDNPRLVDDLVREEMDSGDPSLSALAKAIDSPHISASTLDSIFERYEEFAGLCAASANASEELLSTAAMSEDPSLRAGAASNPRLPQDWMVEMSEDSDPTVLESLLGNPSATDELVARLAHLDDAPIGFDSDFAAGVERGRVEARFGVDAEGAEYLVDAGQWWSMDDDSPEVFVARTMHQGSES